MATMEFHQEISSERYLILIEFVVRHLDFQMAELEAVLGMFKVTDLRRHPLPIAAAVGASDDADKNDDNNYDHNSENHHRSFCLLSLPNDSPFASSSSSSAEKSDESCDSNSIAGIVLSRCALVRSVVEVWGMGSNILECAEATKQWIGSGSSSSDDDDVAAAGSINPRYQLFMDKQKAWKISVLSVGSKYTFQEQEEIRGIFKFLNFPGPVRMKESEEFVVIRESALDNNGSPLYPAYDHQGRKIPENVDRLPLACYFGRILHQRQHKHRAGLHRYTLKKRSYLGPTSMDAELSIIMTNLAFVKQGSMVLDPFCGTGSIMLSCASRGAYTVGTDIDIRVLRGRSSQENIYTNFQQFNLPRPELIRSDNANYSRHFVVDRPPIYDAIVTDPPYGIRAGARQSGSKLDKPRPIADEERHDHIAQTKPYPVSDVMADLVDVAARVLRLGGRLVYIVPSMTDFDPESDLPQHPCLESRHICYQPLSAELGRRVVCLEKTRDYDVSQRNSYLEQIWKNGPKSAEKCANIRERLIAAAKLKPNYEQKAAHRKQKRLEKKHAKKRSKLMNSQNEQETAEATC